MFPFSSHRVTVDVFPQTFMIVVAALFLVFLSILIYADKGLKNLHGELNSDLEVDPVKKEDFDNLT